MEPVSDDNKIIWECYSKGPNYHGKVEKVSGNFTQLNFVFLFIKNI